MRRIVFWGALMLAACGDASDGRSATESPPTPATATPGPRGSSSSLATTGPGPPATAVTTFPGATPEDCPGGPTVELVSSVDRVTMDVIYRYDQTATCGVVADGEAMLNDAFRPAAALLVPTRDLTIAMDADGSASVDVRPLEPAMRLAAIAPTRDLPAAAAAGDGTYPIALPAPGCFVVTVGWSGENRAGQFTGLAESERGLCDDS